MYAKHARYRDHLIEKKNHCQKIPIFFALTLMDFYQCNTENFEGKSF